MNQDHVIAGIGGTSATAMLATVLQHFQAIDTATASAEAGLIVLALGALAGLAQMMLGARKPAASPAAASTEPHP
jgi:hypothetical protein